MIKQMLTCAFLLILIGHHNARTASVNMESSVGVLGNYPHYMKCIFIPGTSESLYTLDMYQIENGAQTKLGSLYSGNPVWASEAPNDIRRRSVLMKLENPTSLQLYYNDTVCGDEKNYTCTFAFGPPGESITQSSSKKVTIEASPGAPTMIAAPGYNITENTTVTFTCSGNVGKPPGQFQWYMYRGSIRENKTDQASPQSNTLATPSCTYTGRSSINITMTKGEQGIVMRCRVYHPTQGSNTNIENCTNPDTTFCRNGERVFVSYPVSISISTPNPNITVDQGSDYILTCSAEGFPLPRLQWFKKSDPNNTLVTSTLETSITLKLQNLSLSDSDVYVCIGFNSVSGAELNDSKQVQITVAPTTTPPPTTTPIKTTTNSKATTTTASSGVADQVQDSGVDKTAIIVGVIVPVVVIIIIVIIVVCICRRRAVKKSPVEEPPEKPFNNHSRINTISSRPDLVSSEKTYPAFDNSKAFVNEDGLTYAQLQLDNKPRSRRPLALDDSHTDYSDISMPQV